MKATGIIRRMDDLGRIVIPKDIRRTLGATEGEAFEIFVEDDCVMFKLYRENERSILTGAIQQIENVVSFDRALKLRKVLKENNFEI
jgi:transcriptional pleiotropic regulator of transition state genes